MNKLVKKILVLGTSVSVCCSTLAFSVLAMNNKDDVVNVLENYIYKLESDGDNNVLTLENYVPDIENEVTENCYKIIEKGEDGVFVLGSDNE